MNEGFPVAWAALRRLSEQLKDPSVSTNLQLETALYASFLPSREKKENCWKRYV